MTRERTILGLGALVFLALGAMFLIAPVYWAAVIDVSLPTPMARTDLRATYGGFDLGFGLFLGLCTLRSDWLRPGLVAMGLALAGFASGRLVGFLVEGHADRLMIWFAALEALGAAVALYLQAGLARITR
jgi:hypothetical protein